HFWVQDLSPVRWPEPIRYGHSRASNLRTASKPCLCCVWRQSLPKHSIGKNIRFNSESEHGEFAQMTGTGIGLRHFSHTNIRTWIYSMRRSSLLSSRCGSLNSLPLRE